MNNISSKGAKWLTKTKIPNIEKIYLSNHNVNKKIDVNWVHRESII